MPLLIGCKKNGKSWVFLGFNDGLMGFNGDLAGLELKNGGLILKKDNSMGFNTI